MISEVWVFAQGDITMMTVNLSSILGWHFKEYTFLNNNLGYFNGQQATLKTFLDVLLLYEVLFLWAMPLELYY